ncbi:MAG: chorismate synthase, partial [Actinobacteria bacterium]|nr:chorismate synthase [Actinomycetota bacterium]
MSSQSGQLFRVSTYGESHGVAVGVVVDGCPPRLVLTEAEIQADLDRRRPGQSRLVTQRNEGDSVEILSGMWEGRTTGTPIALEVRNADHRSAAYDHMSELYRPSHADYTYDAKYGLRAIAGGGRASARETIGRVAAGAVARKLLSVGAGIEVLSWVSAVHT